MTTPSERLMPISDELRKAADIEAETPITVCAAKSSHLTREEVEAFRELASKATPSGKWHMTSDEHCLLIVCDGAIVAEVPFVEERKESQEEIDRADFIAAARNIADRLAAEWEAFREDSQHEEYGRVVVRYCCQSNCRKPYPAWSVDSRMKCQECRMEPTESELAAANARIAELTIQRDNEARWAEDRDAALHACYEGRTNYELLRKDLAKLSGMDHAALTWEEHLARIKAERDALAQRLAEAEATIGKLRKRIDDYEYSVSQRNVHRDD